MPTASVAAAVAMATAFVSASSFFGMKSMMRTPTSGKNVPTDSTQLWSLRTSMPCCSLRY